MDRSKHCQVCDNRSFDVKFGTKCGLTNERPDFDKTCPDILFDKNLEAVIKEVNVEYELARRTKIPSVLNLIIFLSISLAFILAGFLIGKYTWNNGVISTIPIIIMSVGVFILPFASGPFNKYRHGMSVARTKKRQLDELLPGYNIRYEIDVFVTKDLHGNFEIDTKLNFLRKHYR